MAKNISLYKPNIPVTRNIYGVQISGFMPEELEQIADETSRKASKEKAIKEKERKELEKKNAEEERIRKVNNAWVKNIKDKIAKAKSEGLDTSELEQQLSEYIIETKGPIIEPIFQQEDNKIDDTSKDVDMFPSDAEMQDIEKEAKSEIENAKNISLPEFSIDDIKGIKSFAEMQQVDPKITKKDYQHAVNAWHIAQEAGKKIGVDPRLLFGQFGVETLFRDSSVLEQYNYGNIKHFDKSGKIVQQYVGQKAYKDNITGTDDYYLRFDKIEDAIDWYANHYDENSNSRHKLRGDAKKDSLAFAKSLYDSKYYEGDINLPEAQRPYVYQRGIVSQANKWLSGDELTAQQYTEDPYYSDPVEAIADSKKEPQRAKPLINPYGQNVPLNMPRGLVKNPEFLGRIDVSEISGPDNMSGNKPALDIRDTNTKREFIKGSESVPAADVGIANPNKYKSTSSLFHGGIQAQVAGALLAGSNIASLDTMEQVANMRGKVLSQELEDKESKTKNRATTENVDSLTKATKGANAINAINAAVGLGLGIYGAHQINKMQRPSMVSAPQIEAAKIRDTGAQMMTARKGMIEQSANTSREALRRAGRSDLNATITAGETRALNEAAGSIEGMRANINAANVAAENRVREINATTKMQADQFNSQLQASFNQFRSQLGSQNLSTTVQNVSANLGGIAQNNYAQALRERDEDLQLRIARLKN